MRELGDRFPWDKIAAGSMRVIARMKPTNLRATAVTAIVLGFPRACPVSFRLGIFEPVIPFFAIMRDGHDHAVTVPMESNGARDSNFRCPDLGIWRGAVRPLFFFNNHWLCAGILLDSIAERNHNMA